MPWPPCSAPRNRRRPRRRETVRRIVERLLYGQRQGVDPFASHGASQHMVLAGSDGTGDGDNSARSEKSDNGRNRPPASAPPQTKPDPNTEATEDLARRLREYVESLKKQNPSDDEDIGSGPQNPKVPSTPQTSKPKIEEPERPDGNSKARKDSGEERPGVPSNDAVQKLLDDLLGIILLHPMFRRLPELIVPPEEILRDPNRPKDPA